MVFRHLVDAQANLAVIDQQVRPGHQRGEDLGVRQLHTGLVARRVIQVQTERRALLQQDGAVGEDADAQLRSLQVGEDGDRPTEFGFDLADVAVPGRGLLVGAVAHVQAERVCARFDQRPDHLLRGGCGA